MKKTLPLALFITLLLFVPNLFAQAAPAACESSPALIPAEREEGWAVDWWLPRHEEKLNEEGRETARLLFLGDSITQGWESAGADLWDEYYTHYGAHNIGFSGDRTENVLWRLEHGAVDGLNPEITVVMIGTNNTGHRQDPAECTVKGVELILDELTERLPESKILLLSIFPRGETPDDEMRVLNREINSKLAAFESRKNVTWFDINSVFLTDDGVLTEDIMPDLLHPNEAGYQIWAETMQPVLMDLLD